MMGSDGRTYRRWLAPLVLVCLLSGLVTLASARPATAVADAFNHGDIFASVGAGQVKHFTHNGLLQATLDTTSGSHFGAGLCLDAQRQLYVANFSSETISRFDRQGVLNAASWGGPYSINPTDCVVDGNDEVLTSEGGGDNKIRRFATDGTLLQTYSPPGGRPGISGMALMRGDDCTLYYTSRVGTVQRYDLCLDQPLPDLATGLSGACYHLAVRPNGEVLVACDFQAYRLAADGMVLRIYAPVPEAFFPLALDTDEVSFWLGGRFSGTVYNLDIASGALLGQFDSSLAGPQLKGLVVFEDETGPTSVALTGISGAASGPGPTAWLLVLLGLGLLAASVSGRRRWGWSRGRAVVRAAMRAPMRNGRYAP